MPKPASFPKRSGDSKLQDGQKARQENRLETKPDVRELPDLLQDSAEKKRAAGASEEVASQTERALEKLTAALEAVSKRNSDIEARLAKYEGSGVQAGRKAVRFLGPKCSVCHQIKKDLTGRGVCSGTHKMTLVAPADMALWSSFPGVKWNGVYYAGYRELPVEIIQDVISQVRRWETNEKKLFIKGGTVFGGDGKFETANTAVAPIIAPS